MTKISKSNGIKSWPLDDRPREKLLKKGAGALSNSELLAILLRTGTKGTSAIDLSRKILGKFGGFFWFYKEESLIKQSERFKI